MVRGPIIQDAVEAYHKVEASLSEALSHMYKPLGIVEAGREAEICSSKALNVWTSR